MEVCVICNQVIASDWTKQRVYMFWLEDESKPEIVYRVSEIPEQAIINGWFKRVWAHPWCVHEL